MYLAHKFELMCISILGQFFSSFCIAVPCVALLTAVGPAVVPVSCPGGLLRQYSGSSNDAGPDVPNVLFGAL